MKSTKRKPKTGSPTRGGVSAARLAEMIEEATVDANDEYEQATGWFTALSNNLEIPFDTKIFGVTVTVKRLDLRDDNLIVALPGETLLRVDADGVDGTGAPSPKERE